MRRRLIKLISEFSALRVGVRPNKDLGGRFGYFLFFLLGGGGRGRAMHQEGGGVRFLLKNARRGGGVLSGEGGRARGREGVCGDFGRGGG